MVPMVFVWNFTPDRLRRLRETCDSLRIGCRAVLPSECRMAVKALPVESSGVPGLAAVPFAGEMLLMRGLSSSQVDALLAGLKTSGLAPVPLKAVMTPFNADWDSLKLNMELTQEHTRITR